MKMMIKCLSFSKKQLQGEVFSTPPVIQNRYILPLHPAQLVRVITNFYTALIRLRMAKTIL